MKSPSLALLLSLLISTGACSSTEPDDELPVIGAILATSGPAEYIGGPEKDVLERLQQDYEGQGFDIGGVTLDIRDSGGDPTQALALFEQLSANPNVIAIIGPSTSGESIVLAPLAPTEGIPLLSLGASSIIVRNEDGSVNRWTFKFAQNDDLAARRLISEMNALNHTDIALLYQDDGFGRNGQSVFAAEAQSSGVGVVHNASFASNLSDPGPVASAAISVDSDAVLIWGTAPGPSLLVTDLRSRGFDGQIYLSHGNASKDFIASAGAAAEGAILVGSRVLTHSDFLDPDVEADDVILEFKQRFGEEPSHFGGHARDAYEALIAIIRDKNVLRGDPVEWRQNVCDALETLSPFYGVTGTFNFSAVDHAGLDVGAFGTYRISQGAFVPIQSR